VSRLTAEIIAPDDARWTAVLQRARHDVYHLPEYARAAAHQEGGSAAAFYAESGTAAVVAPLLIRELQSDLDAPAGWNDATSPYGYSGPIATHGADELAVRRMLGAFPEVAARCGIVTTFFRLHPFRGVAHSALEQFGRVVRHGPVVYIDLSKSRAELTAETRSNHRRNITQLVRDGFRAEMDQWHEYAGFREAYRMTMRHNSAAAYYYFSDTYFEELHRLLGSRLHLCTVRAPSGEVAGAGLFTTVDGVVEYHLGATVDTFRSLAPSKLMFDAVRWWAKDRGESLLNLGGGVGAGGGPLLHFKAGFSPLRADFHSCRVTIDEGRYAMLLRSRRETAGYDAAAASGYFPEYRSP
jgi:hypothetical protein